MSEIQVNTVRPVSGTTLTVAGGTTVEITGAGLLQTPEVQGTNLVIDGTGQLELQRSGAQRVLINASGTTVTGNLTVSGGGVITGDGSGLTGLVGVGVGGSSSTGNLQLMSNSGGANGARDIIFLDNNSEKARLYGATGNLAVDTDTLFVDAANNRVGIGKTTPASTLDVNGTCTATAFVGPVTGNVTGDVVATNLTGTIQSAAQPNITSTGALTVPSISVTGNITGSTVGALAASLLPSGSVLQVVEAFTTTVTNYTTTTGWAAISGMSVTITPKRATSKIFVIASWQSYLFAAAAASSWISARIMRGATPLSTHGAVQFGSATVSTMSQLCIFDSESSPGTSAVTYSLELQSSMGISGSTYNPQVAQVGWTFSGSPTPRHRIIVVEVAV